MANVMMVLKSEIVRLARKETKAEMAPAKKTMATQRGLIADLRRQVNTMQKELNALKKTAPVSTRVKAKKEQSEGRFWITGKGVKALRKKLGLTQAKFAELAGVSLPTVCNWESVEGKISIRRKDTVAHLKKIRGMNKRKAAKVLGS